MVDRRSTVELVLLFLLFQSAFGQSVRLSSATERAALLTLRSSLGLRGKDWPKKLDPCSSWTGVRCRGDGRVVEINISGLRRSRFGLLNPQFSVDALANLTLLGYFNSSGFSLPGPIPVWFGQRLSSLRVLDLRSSSVSGIIPSTLSQLSRLSVLDLSQNSLTGSIHSSFSFLSNLTVLDFSSNFLSGTIPPALGTLSKLQVLNLSTNSFSGSIPVELGELSRLVDLDLSSNSLSGSLPQDLRGWRNLQKLVIGGNDISGGVPDILWSMPELRFLDVSKNNLTGALPNLSSNANATAAVFDLSHNLFYGGLTSLLWKSSFVDLSNNYVQGKVPDGTPSNASLASNCLQNVTNQRSLEDCSFFYAERGLSFDNFGVPNTIQTRKNNRRLVFILAGVFGGFGFIVILVLVLVVLLINRERGVTDGGIGAGPVPAGSGVTDRGIGVGPVPEGRGAPPPEVSIKLPSLLEKAFTYEQLLQATGNFSDSNLIKHGHSGDLFRGILEGGILVVIKRIDLRSFKKEAYMVELELFSRASHTRLVPLMGHCLEHENEKLMVYKYMPNRDLSNSFYRTNLEDDSFQSLDWITRLKIATGAAEGLFYLHQCTPPLVHRDVQASSILLDDKFEVRLGSLSEVCAQEGDAHQNVITRLLRLPTMSEQGPSGSPSATSAYDIYCFGKVLLELVTGKLGISMSDDAATKEWLEHTLPYINTYDKELVTKIVDPTLLVDEDLLEEVWAMAIVARSCLNPKPFKRPLMRYILKALENPVKVVRDENFSFAGLRTTSSRGSWNAAFFGSWHRSSSDIVAVPGSINREKANSLKQLWRTGSQGSGQGGGCDLSSSRKKLSREIFPEQADLRDIERPNYD